MKLVRGLLSNRVLRFGIVGIFNTGFSYCVYALALYAGFSYFIASLVSIVLGIAVGFVAQGALVFGNQSRWAFVRFVLVWAVIYVAYLVVVAVTQKFGVNAYIGGLIATPITACLSYLLQSRFVFSAREHS